MLEKLFQMMRLGLMCTYFGYCFMLMALAVVRVQNNRRWAETTVLARFPASVRIACYAVMCLVVFIVMEVLFTKMQEAGLLLLLGGSAFLVLLETALACDLMLYYRQEHWASGALLMMATVALLYLKFQQEIIVLWLVLGVVAWFTVLNGSAEAVRRMFGLTEVKIQEKRQDSMAGLPTTEFVVKVVTVAYTAMFVMSCGYVGLSKLGVEFPF